MQSESNVRGVVTVGMMAKYWAPGRVKTRLGATIGLEKSARLHKLFVTTLAKSLVGNIEERSPWQFVAVVTPDEKQTDFGRAIGPAWATAKQSDGDLGYRMQHWFSHTLQQTIKHGSPNGTASSGILSRTPNGMRSSSAILVGADCPTLDSSVILETTRQLENHDLVLGPAVDGGYYLIAIRGPWRDCYQTLFDEMPWSTENVLAITKQRANDNGISLALLQQREDIDTADALDRLRDALLVQTDPKSRELLTRIDGILVDDAEKETRQ